MLPKPATDSPPVLGAIMGQFCCNRIMIRNFITQLKSSTHAFQSSSLTKKIMSRSIGFFLATFLIAPSTRAIPSLQSFSTLGATLLKNLPPRPKPPPDSEIEESYLKGSGPGGQKIVRTDTRRILQLHTYKEKRYLHGSPC